MTGGFIFVLYRLKTLLLKHSAPQMNTPKNIFKKKIINKRRKRKKEKRKTIIGGLGLVRSYILLHITPTKD